MSERERTQVSNALPLLPLPATHSPWLLFPPLIPILVVTYREAEGEELSIKYVFPLRISTTRHLSLLSSLTFYGYELTHPITLPSSLHDLTIYFQCIFPPTFTFFSLFTFSSPLPLSSNRKLSPSSFHFKHIFSFI
jgi:hypothetical protein